MDACGDVVYVCHQHHGFRKSHSCETQLISTIQDIAVNLDQRTQTDMVIMDFSKSFDMVPHQRLLLKLWRYGIKSKTHRCITSFLTQRKQCVVLDGETSEWVQVEFSVPQGTITSPLYFLLFINDLPNGLCSDVRLFANDLEVNKCAFTFSSEIRQINARALNFDAFNARGPHGRVHWTSIKFRQVHWICLISRANVNANLLT